MKRRLLCLLSAALVLAAAFSFVPYLASSASATVDMSFSPSPADVGKNVTISVAFNADEAIGVVEAYLIYDPDFLTFVSGDSASGGGGSVNIVGVGNGTNKKLTYALTFTCLKAGIGNVQITSSNVISYATEASIGGGVAYCYVQIGSTATATPAPTATSTPKPTATPTPSSSATATPTSSATATATPTPTSETTSDPENTESIRIEVDGRVLYLWPSLADVTLPDGFWAASYTYKEATVQVARGDYKNMLLFYLTDSNGENGRFYVYDETADTFSMLINLDIPTASYSFVDVDESLQVPEGYVSATMYVGEDQVPAWTLPSDTEGRYALVYVMNPSGEAAFYVYDSQEKTMQRYVDRTVTVEVPVEQETTTAPTAVPETETPETRNLLQRIWDDKSFLIMTVILILLVIGAAIAIGYLCIRFVGHDDDSSDGSVYTIGHDDDTPPTPPNPFLQHREAPPVLPEPEQPTKAVEQTPSKPLLHKPQRRVGFEDTEGYDPDVHPSRGMQNPLIPPDDYVPPQSRGPQPLGKHGQRPADTYDTPYVPYKTEQPTAPQQPETFTRPTQPAAQPAVPAQPLQPVRRMPESDSTQARTGGAQSYVRPTQAPTEPTPSAQTQYTRPTQQPSRLAQAPAGDADVKTYYPHTSAQTTPPATRGGFQVRQASQPTHTPTSHPTQPSQPPQAPQTPTAQTPPDPNAPSTKPTDPPYSSDSPKWR